MYNFSYLSFFSEFYPFILSAVQNSELKCEEKIFKERKNKEMLRVKLQVKRLD